MIRMHRESVAPQWERAPLATAIFLAFAAAAPAHAAGGDPLAAPAAVGTVTTGPVSNQYPARSQSVARSAGSNFVVTWVGLDGSIQARRYSANALPLDDGFTVAAAAASPAVNGTPRVAMNDAGAFVVTWRKRSSATAATLYGQRYDANGSPAGAAFVISNSPGGATDSAAAVAMDDAGDFVTAWSRTLPTKTTNNLSTFSHTVLAQRYTHTGGAAGAQLTVITHSDSTFSVGNAANPILGLSSQTSVQNNVDVAMDSAGDFVVGWAQQGTLEPFVGVPCGNGSCITSPLGIGVTSWELHAKRYDASGKAPLLGGNTLLRTSLAVAGLRFTTPPSLAMDAKGNFVAAWVEPGVYGGGVYAQRVSAAGLPLGLPAMMAQSDPISSARYPEVSVAADKAGDFVVAWEDFQKTDINSISARRYSASSKALAAAFTVAASNVSAAQVDMVLQPAVASDANGNFVIAWSHLILQSFGQPQPPDPVVLMQAFQGP